MSASSYVPADTATAALVAFCAATLGLRADALRLVPMPPGQGGSRCWRVEPAEGRLAFHRVLESRSLLRPFDEPVGAGCMPAPDPLAPLAWLKQPGSPRKLAQELGFHRAWAAGLARRVPRLLAVYAPAWAPGALLLGHVAGHAPALDPADSATEAHFAAAGQWLRCLHAQAVAIPDPMPLAVALQRRFAALAQELAALGEVRLAQRLAALARGHAPCAPQLDRVPCHRDFAPRNWLVRDASADAAPEQAEALGFAVVDFEHARPDHPLVDWLGLAPLWAEQPGWRAAFVRGYGEDLAARAPQDHALLMLASGARGLAWALRHRDERELMLARAQLAQQ